LLWRADRTTVCRARAGLPPASTDRCPYRQPQWGRARRPIRPK